MITQDILKSKVTYDKTTGIFLHKKRSGVKAGRIAGSLTSYGYISIKVNKKAYGAHRLAWLYEYGSLPTSSIDHINHNRVDNRIDNLRICITDENSKNRKLYNNNPSGATGVRWRKDRWEARIGVDGKSVHLGTFSEYSEAVNARKNAEVLYGFHENHGKDV